MFVGSRSGVIYDAGHSSKQEVFVIAAFEWYKMARLAEDETGWMQLRASWAKYARA